MDYLLYIEGFRSSSQVSTTPSFEEHMKNRGRGLFFNISLTDGYFGFDTTKTSAQLPEDTSAYKIIKENTPELFSDGVISDQEKLQTLVDLLKEENKRLTIEGLTRENHGDIAATAYASIIAQKALLYGKSLATTPKP